MATLALQVQELIDLLPHVPQKDIDFACNLVNRYNRYKTLLNPNTGKDSGPWVQTLIDRAKGIVPAQPQRTSAQVGDLSGLLILFRTAGAHKLKFPKIRLQVDRKPVVLSVSGPQSKTPGSISLSNGGKYGSPDNVWYGRVSPEGQFDGSRQLTPEFAALLIPILTELATDPYGAVQRYASLTGNCCFCGFILNEESSAAGMGETCSKHFGLHDHYKAATKAHRATAKAVAA
jgi:hypothetical protein